MEGTPRLAERGRRPFKPQTVLLRWMPSVGSTYSPARAEAAFGNRLREPSSSSLSDNGAVLPGCDLNNQ